MRSLNVHSATSIVMLAVSALAACGRGRICAAARSASNAIACARSVPRDVVRLVVVFELFLGGRVGVELPRELVWPGLALTFTRARATDR